MFFSHLRKNALRVVQRGTVFTPSRLKGNWTTFVGAMAPFAQSAYACACPLCDSERAGEVRSGLFNADLAMNLCVTVLPFIVLGAVIGLVRHTPRLRRRAHLHTGRHA